MNGLAKVLIVEDDEELANLMRDYLSSKQLQLDVIYTGIDAPEHIIKTQPDVVILDLMLPGKDGVTICREVRPHFSKGILMLTASDDSVDHVVGLEVGADDFVNKPIEPRVLLARVRALLRRFDNNNNEITPNTQATQQDQQLKFKNLVINISCREAKLNDSALELTTPEYDLLVFLAKQAGNIVSREEVFQALKNIEYDGQNRFADITISQIRKKLGHEADDYLKTVRGKGYLFLP